MQEILDDILVSKPTDKVQTDPELKSFTWTILSPCKQEHIQNSIWIFGYVLSKKTETALRKLPFIELAEIKHKHGTRVNQHIYVYI